MTAQAAPLNGVRGDLARGRRLCVVHLVDAMNAGSRLWGKERVIAALMEAQLQSLDVLPRLITFIPCSLGAQMGGRGFEVAALEREKHVIPVRGFFHLRRLLSDWSPDVLHTHGYKANIIGRAVRAAGAPTPALVSTCHGWIDETLRTHLYNRLDRATAFASDAVTVTDARMIQKFPAAVRAAYVSNGLPARRLPTPAERVAARAQYGLQPDAVVAGMLARTDAAKGIREVVAAARQTTGSGIQWVIAGTGPLDDEIRAAAVPNLTFLGYVEDAGRYLDALDVFLQASYTEGLSLALLEAMRAGLPIVATPVGSTLEAVRNGSEASIVEPKSAEALVRAVRALADSEDLRARLGTAAHDRFERHFRIEKQHEAFLNIYRSHLHEKA